MCATPITTHPHTALTVLVPGRRPHRPTPAPCRRGPLLLATLVVTALSCIFLLNILDFIDAAHSQQPVSWRAMLGPLLPPAAASGRASGKGAKGGRGRAGACAGSAASAPSLLLPLMLLLLPLWPVALLALMSSGSSSNGGKVAGPACS